MLVAFVLTLTIPTITAQSADSWPMFHYDSAHTGSTNSAAPLTKQMLWNYTTGVGVRFAAVEGSPAVAGGVVYVGSNDGKVYALDAFGGSPLWNFTTGGPVSSSLAIFKDTVFVSSNDRKLYALDAQTGNIVWNYTVGSALSSPSVSNGIVYVGARN